MFGKSENREDYQHIDRSVGGMARNLPDKSFIDFHQHTRSQLIYTSYGAILVITSQGSWVVPPHRAVWIPSNTQHAMKTIGTVKMRTLYISEHSIPHLPKHCCVISVSSLLREIIIAITKMPINYDENDRDGLIVQLFFKEMKPLRIVPLFLPIPDDHRLSKICNGILNEPTNKNSLEMWGDLVGASKRTLIRLFQIHTGMTFRQWTQQAKITLSVQMLAKKYAINHIAFQLGYDSPSAFSAMFRKTLGVTPSEYFIKEIFDEMEKS
ncbi:MAG: helix-turn-helix transcriptional regulator [Pseudomonadota bacterium]